MPVSIVTDRSARSAELLWLYFQLSGPRMRQRFEMIRNRG